MPSPPVWKERCDRCCRAVVIPSKRGELLVLPKSFHHTLVLTLCYEPLVALWRLRSGPPYNGVPDLRPVLSFQAAPTKWRV